MSDIIAVTNRALSPDDFLSRIGRIAAARPAAIILREKDLDEAAYERIAKSALDICRASGTRLIIHGFWRIAERLGSDALHMPLAALREMPAEKRAAFPVLGASCHSVDDAEEAVHLGCTYIIAGHIYDTDSKKGTPGRGLDFLKNVCGAVSVPVYAIGGISPENIGDIRAAGAAGACVMSGAMRADNTGRYFAAFAEGEK